MKQVRIVLPVVAFFIAIAGAFATVATEDLLLSPYGANPYSVPANQCQPGTIVNDSNGTCAVQSASVTCLVRFTSGGSSTDVSAYEGASNCGVSTQLIMRPQ